MGSFMTTALGVVYEHDKTLALPARRQALPSLRALQFALPWQ